MEKTLEKINEYLVDVFNQMLDIEESSLAQSQFKDLSIKEMHAIEANRPCTVNSQQQKLPIH